MDQNNDIYDAFDNLKKAMEKLNHGPVSYYLDNLISHSHALLTKYSPFKVGDKVELKGNIPCDGGWAGNKQDLVAGALATVHSVEYRSDQFVFDVVLDVESWVNSDTKERTIIPDERRHTFGLSERWLAKPGTLSAFDKNQACPNAPAHEWVHAEKPLVPNHEGKMVPNFNLKYFFKCKHCGAGKWSDSPDDGAAKRFVHPSPKPQGSGDTAYAHKTLKRREAWKKGVRPAGKGKK